MIHACPDCGLIHGIETVERDNDALKIAKLEADRDIRIAEIQAHAEMTSSRHESEALSGVVEALTEVPEDEDNYDVTVDPVIINAPEDKEKDTIQVEDNEGDEDHQDEPEVKEIEAPKTHKPKSRGLGAWG